MAATQISPAPGQNFEAVAKSADEAGKSMAAAIVDMMNNNASAAIL